MAGSSWPPDEEIFIPFFNEHKDWRMLIAPHVIAEEHLKLILSLLKDKEGGALYSDYSLRKLLGLMC